MLVLSIILAVLLVLSIAGTITLRARRRSLPRATPSRTEAVPLRGTIVEKLPVGGVEETAPPEVEPATTALAEPTAAPPEESAGPPSFRDRLGKARGLFAGLATLRSKRGIEAANFEMLEEALLRADVGVATTQAILSELQARVAAKEVVGGDQLIASLRAQLLEVMGTDAAERALHFDEDPEATNVWLFVGVNGVGKTTTIGKLARQEARAGRSVLLAAGDTFRAAASEQLALWAERAGVEIVSGSEGGDPSAVVFDAVQRAQARGHDLVLADTAGRLHTKVNLVEELKKIRRVAERPPGKVTEVLLVIDATTGQNALIQAREFTGAVGVTGVVVTKLDGSAKGGVVIAVQRELGLPVKLVGLGEGLDDLVPFDPEAFVDALLDS
jgi:fused signal recognition particle receptor